MRKVESEGSRLMKDYLPDRKIKYLKSLRQEELKNAAGASCESIASPIQKAQWHNFYANKAKLSAIIWLRTKLSSADMTRRANFLTAPYKERRQASIRTLVGKLLRFSRTPKSARSFESVYGPH